MPEAPRCFCRGTTAKRKTPGMKLGSEWCFSVRPGPASTIWNLWVWREHRGLLSSGRGRSQCLRHPHLQCGESSRSRFSDRHVRITELVPRGDWKSRNQKADTRQSTEARLYSVQWKLGILDHLIHVFTPLGGDRREAAVSANSRPRWPIF